MTRPTLALALIVKNEEENLPRLFKSVEGCFDEIHVTDTGSTDRTVEVALALGARVHHFQLCDDFSAARNASFEPVKTDYVMWLDADDVLENPEEFKLFRDNVMGLGDFHLAVYHYASDGSGKPVCSFLRERVFKVGKQFRWTYPIHEGVVPKSPYGEVRVMYSPSWTVRHMRTEADLKKDRSRNLRVFESFMRSNKLDARMRYYYGKELFEAGNPVDAISVLKDTVTATEMELHDRILAYQYLCLAYMQCNQFERALSLSLQGVTLAPSRAEFHVLAGDACLKLGRPLDAIPFYSAAKGCRMQSHAAPIFQSEEQYTSFPRNQIARILGNIGDLDGAEKEAIEADRLYKHPDSAAIVAEVKRIKGSLEKFTDASDCDDIVITTAPQTAYEFDPGVAEKKAMGGSETALIEVARHLHKLSGRKVIVFNMREKDGTFDGVEYRSNKQVHDYFHVNRPYFHVAWRHNLKLTDAPTFVWCHDLTTPGLENHAQYLRALALTPFHREYMRATQLVPVDKIHLTRNGVRPERFSDGPWKKEPFRFVFGSSPDRGLDRAMRVLDRVRVKYPEIKLHVHYGIEHLGRYGLQPLADKLKAMMEERKDWVIYHGATQQDELMASYKASAFCVQPSDWIETSMISARELVYCGVYPIMRALGGVKDTLAEAVKYDLATLVESDCITEAEHDLYAQKVIEAIERVGSRDCARSLDPNDWSWEGVAQQWLDELPALIGSKPALKQVRCEAV